MKVEKSHSCGIEFQLQILMFLRLTLLLPNALAFEDQPHQRQEQNRIDDRQRTERLVEPHSFSKGQCVEADVESEDCGRASTAYMHYRRDAAYPT